MESLSPEVIWAAHVWHYFACLSQSFFFLIFKILNSLCFQKLRMEISFFFFKFLCWSIADVLVSGVQQSESGIHMHYLFFLQNSFPINITEY